MRTFIVNDLMMCSKSWLYGYVLLNIPLTTKSNDNKIRILIQCNVSDIHHPHLIPLLCGQCTNINEYSH